MWRTAVLMHEMKRGLAIASLGLNHKQRTLNGSATTTPTLAEITKALQDSRRMQILHLDCQRVEWVFPARNVTGHMMEPREALERLATVSPAISSGINLAQ